MPGRCRCEADLLGEFRGEVGGLTQEERIDVDGIDPRGGAKPGRKQPIQGARAAADIEDAAAGLRRQEIDEGAEHGLIGRRPSAVLESRDAADVGAAKPDDGEVPGELRQCRLPLRGARKNGRRISAGPLPSMR